jgi:hypothetical protein
MRQVQVLIIRSSTSRVYHHHCHYHRDHHHRHNVWVLRAPTHCFCYIKHTRAWHFGRRALVPFIDLPLSTSTSTDTTRIWRFGCRAPVVYYGHCIFQPPMSPSSHVEFRISFTTSTFMHIANVGANRTHTLYFIFQIKVQG